MTKYRSIIIVLVLLLSTLFFQVVYSGPNTPLFTKEQIFKFSKRARPDLADALVDNQQYLHEAGITTPLRLAHFLAQVATETNGMRRIDENMNYSAERLLQVFSRRVITPKKAKEIEHKPVDIANWVYRNRLGNGGPETNDGWSYRGSGFIQLTGRDNFRMRGMEIGLPLEQNPEMVRKGVEGLLAATAYWMSQNINIAADKHNIYRVREKINPAQEGMPAAKMWFRRIGPVLGLSVKQSTFESGVESDGSDMEDAANILESLGFISAGALESNGLAAETFTDGLREYQKSRGLKETGVLDEDTFYSITDPQEWKKAAFESDGEVITFNPDSGVSFALNGKPEANVDTIVALNPNEGAGVFDLSKKLSEAELSNLTGASAAYSEYEMATGQRDKNDNFIPNSVIKPDQRVVVLDTTAFPARAIVQIGFTANAKRFLCSGAMISPDTVLTAGHCVHSGTRWGHTYSNFKIYPGRNIGSIPFGECGATKAFALKGWVEAADSSEARNYDLGAIKLDCNIGNKTGWFGVKVLSNADEKLSTTVQGYAGDRTPAGRQWVSNDFIRVLYAQKGFYQNDTYGGTSGSPVYSGKDYHLIGIHTNGLHNGEPWKSNNAFTRITPGRLKEISSWIDDSK